MRSVILSFVAALTLLPAPVSAQTPRPERPYRGLFGTGVDNSGDLLTLVASVGGGYDDNVFEHIGAGGTGDTAETGPFAQATGTLNYSRSRERGAFGATLATDARYFQDLPGEIVAAYNGSVGGSLRLGQRTDLRATQTVGFQPYLTFGLFPVIFEPPVGQSFPADLNQGAQLDDYWTYSTNAEIERQLSRRTSVSGSYEAFIQDRQSSDDDLSIQSVGGRLGIELSRGLGARIGYRYQEARYQGIGGRTVEGHTIDVGVDYSKALSLSRRTTFSFATGSAAYSDLGQTQFELIGSAELNHEIGRTWTTAVAYARTFSFVPSFEQPFLSDSVTAGLSGLLHRRVQFSANIGASFGAVGFNEGDTNYTSYTTNAGFTISLTRRLALIGSYTYYFYTFGEDVIVPLGLVREQDRQVALMSLNMFFPLFYRPRRA